MNDNATALAAQDKTIPLQQPKAKQDSDWVKTPMANLVLYKPSGIYFIRAKVNGRLFRKSLKTASYEIAVTKLQRTLFAERGRVSLGPDEDLTFGDMVTEWQLRLESDPSKKERAVEYRTETLKNGVRAFWPGIDSLKPKDFTESAVLSWSNKVRAHFSAPRYNGVVQTLRGILQVAVDRGLLLENPARGRKRNSVKGVPAATVPLTPPKLPELDQFQALLEALDRVPERAKASRMIKFMAYSGCRVSAARQMTLENFDFQRNQVVLPKVKYDVEPVRVPMISEMQELAEQLKSEHSGEGTLFQIQSPRKALKHACRDAGISPPMTPHDLRHIFVTRCIECDVDIPTIAKWCGHKDGGRVLLKIYAHLLDKHSQEQAAKVNFKVAAVVPK
jgi:integrase